MPILTLSPARGIPSGGFDDAAYAYAIADRPVRKDGNLVTPEPLVDESRDGEMSFDLFPNSTIDHNEDFKYIVAAFDKYGLQIFKISLVMPEEDSLIWDLYPEPVDLDTNVVVDTPIDSISQGVTETEALNTIQGKQLAAHVAADLPFTLVDFIIEAKKRTSYTYNVETNGQRHNVLIPVSTIDWDTISSWEQVHEWIVANTSDTFAGRKVRLIFNGVRFSLISDDAATETLRFEQHGTSTAPYMRLDNYLGFTTGSFGALAVNAVEIPGDISNEGIITGALLSEPTAPVVAISGALTYYLNGQLNVVEDILIDQNMNGYALAARLQSSIPNSSFWYDGERLRMSILNLTGVDPSGLGGLLNLDFVSGAQIAFPVGSSFKPTLPQS